MKSVLLIAIVTGGWVVVEGFIGGFLLGRKGRPYKAPGLVIHLVLFLPVAAGWFYTVQGLSALSGNHAGSWIAEIVMGLGAVVLLIGGAILTGGRRAPAPKGLVLSHQIGVAVALLGSLAGIVCLLVGA